MKLKIAFAAMAMMVAATATSASAASKPSVSEIVSKDQFEQIFPGHDPFYTYDGFVKGADAAEGFCTTGDLDTRIRDCAAFLANAKHETGSGRYVTEIARNKCPDYCDVAQPDPCAPAKGKSYYGRGWLQISWNYNYCAASKFIFKDNGRKLVQDPDILEKDPAIATQASLWYWMTQNSAAALTPHDSIVKGKGFGETIMAINGDLECRGKNPGQVNSRVRNYREILENLGGGKVKLVGKNEC